MATWDDVRDLALALPDTAEGTSWGNRALKVRGRTFAWERPLRDADLKALGERAPAGPVLGAHVEHLVAKEALLADPSGVYFTTPHFDGYAAVLVELDRIGRDELRDLLVEAWLCRAPKRLAAAYVADAKGSDPFEGGDR